MTALPRLRGWLFVALLIILAVSYCTRDRYKSVERIDPETVFAPVQTPIRDASPIRFSRDGYDFTLLPLFDYTLTGLVLSAQDYDRWFSISRTDRTFAKDICVLWGKTLQSRVHQDDALAVEQDMRWCFFRFQRNLAFDATEMSNNHLIAVTSAIRRQIGTIHGGDQVRIRGKLVNVRAAANGAIRSSEHPSLEWTTSTTRDDTGAGACEIVYVESVEILQKGNRLAHLLFSTSLYGAALLLAWWIAGTIAATVLVQRRM
jgi:hypothetical protein